MYLQTHTGRLKRFTKDLSAIEWANNFTKNVNTISPKTML